MSKTLHTVQIRYLIEVAADVDEAPEDVAKRFLSAVLRNETPHYSSLGPVHRVSESNKWYDRIPYGDTEGNPSQYYSTEEIKNRRDVVAMVKSYLTEKEWETLKLYFGEIPK